MLRSLSAVEHAFWLANRSVSNHIVYAAEITGAPTPQAWRAAFDSLQRRHPLLSVRVPATPNGWPYFEFVHDQGIPLRHAVDACWNIESVAAEWLDETLARELDETVDHDTAPLMRAVIATGRDRSVVVIAVSHAIYDGISVARCFSDIVAALNGEPLDALPFPRSMNHLLGEPDAVAPQEKISLEGVPYPQGNPPAVRRMRLSRGLTEQLIQRARYENTTVHGALCGAFVMSGRSLLPHWRSGSITLHSPVDLRRLWEGRYECGFFLTSTKATLEPERDASLWELAREIIGRMDPNGARESAKAGVRQYNQYLSNGMDAKGVMQIPGTEKAPDLGITNVGVLPDTHPSSRYRLTGLWGPLVRGRNPSYLTVAVSSVDGCIHLTMMNLAPLPSFLEKAQALLTKACGV